MQLIEIISSVGHEIHCLQSVVTYAFFLHSWTASMMREGSYSTIRFGIYEPIKVQLGATDPAHTPLWKKITAGAAAGNLWTALFAAANTYFISNR